MNQQTTTIEVTPAEARHIAAMRSMTDSKRVIMFGVILHMAQCFPRQTRPNLQLIVGGRK